MFIAKPRCGNRTTNNGRYVPHRLQNGQRGDNDTQSNRLLTNHCMYSYLCDSSCDFSISLSVNCTKRKISTFEFSRNDDNLEKQKS